MFSEVGVMSDDRIKELVQQHKVWMNLMQGNDIEIKSGYLVNIKVFDREYLCTVQYSILDELVCSSPEFWVELDMFNEFLEIESKIYDTKIQIAEIWGRTYGHATHARSTNDRELLWKREE